MTGTQQEGYILPKIKGYEKAPMYGYCKIIPNPDQTKKPQKIPCNEHRIPEAQAAGLIPKSDIKWNQINNVDCCLRLSLGGKITDTGEIIEKPAPIAILDYDEIINPETGEYEADIPDDLKKEIDYLRKSTFCEFSISGKGIHAILWDNLPDENIGLSKKERKTELYSGNRFFAITGKKCPESPETVENLDILNEIYNKIKPVKKIQTQTPLKTGKTEIKGKTKEFRYKGLEPEIQEWYLETHKIEDALIDTGTHLPTSDPNRLLYNKSTTGAAGTLINHTNNKAYELHAGSPYATGKPTNPIDVKIHECGGDQEKAIKQINAEYKQHKHDEEKAAEIAAIPKNIKEDAGKIYKEGKALEYLEAAIQAEHVGDKHVIRALLLSIAQMHIYNGQGLHIAITGAAGAGKSHATSTVLKYTPERWYQKARMSNMALFYHKIQAGTILRFDDQDLNPVIEELLKNTSTEWNESYQYNTVGTDRKPLTLEIPERCPYWLTKAEGTGDEQTNDRMLSLWIEDTPDQREAKRKAVFAKYSPKTQQEKEQRERKKQTCIALWLLIAEHADTVVIPYLDEISTPENPESRLLDLFCSMIQSSAFLDAENREKDEKTGAIMANWDDFKTAAELMNPLIKNEGGSQRLKLTPDEKKILDYLLNDHPAEGDIPRVNIETGTGLNGKRVSRALIGRNDRDGESGLMGKVVGLEKVSVTTTTTGEEKISRKMIHWNPILYKQWLRGENDGFCRKHPD